MERVKAIRAVVSMMPTIAYRCYFPFAVITIKLLIKIPRFFHRKQFTIREDIKKVTAKKPFGCGVPPDDLLLSYLILGLFLNVGQ